MRSTWFFKMKQGIVKLSSQQIDKELHIKVYDNGPSFPQNIESGYGLKSMYDKLDIPFFRITTLLTLSMELINVFHISLKKILLHEPSI